MGIERDKEQEKGIRILHVEDDAGEARLTKLFLKKKGYDIFKIASVLSAEQGLKMLGKEKFDVVISDYMMPGMNGMEFLEVLRREGNNIPFIIFTGKGEEAVAMEAINKGANRYVKKDEKPSVLFDTLARYIQDVVKEKETVEETARRMKLLEAMNKRLQNVLKASTAERKSEKKHIDTSQFLNEHIDLIIVGLLVNKNEAMPVSDMIDEIHSKFDFWVRPESLKDPLDELEEKGIIELEFSKDLKTFRFKLDDGMDGLLRGPTFSRDMLTRFLSVANGFSANE